MPTTLIARRCLIRNAMSRYLNLQIQSLHSSFLLNAELSSLLYISGEMAQKVVSILKPAVSFNVTDEDIKIMHQNIDSRRLTCNFDLFKLRNEFQRLETLRPQVEKSKAEHAKLLKKQGATQESKPDEMESAKKRLRELTKSFSHLEESVIPQLLLLPNRLHAETPNSEQRVTYEFDEPPRFNFEVASHEELGRKSDTIVWTPLVGPGAFYFMGDVALFERVALDYFRVQFKANDFVALSNPDFTKSIIVEGCGISFSDPAVTYHLEKDHDANVHIPVDLHLTGSASFMAFCAFHSKTIVKVANLPLKYYASGRRYNPILQTTAESSGLFAVNQNTALSFFIATENESEAEKEFNAVLKILNNAFEKLGLHFRTVAVSAPKLGSSESKRTDIQMWSPARKEYFTVSHVALHDDFISRRLLMLYQKGKRNNNFLHVVSGTAISIPSFVACVIENLQTESQSFTLPLELIYK